MFCRDRFTVHHNEETILKEAIDDKENKSKED